MPAADVLSALVFHPERVTHEAIAAVDPGDLAEAAERQQVVTLALRGLRRAGAAGAAACRPHVDAMQHMARLWTMHEALEREAIVPVLQRAAGLRLLFFKGAALAYGVYDVPADRMRIDWDVLIDTRDAAAAERALVESGFVKDVKTPGRIRVRQHSYRRALEDGECAVDLHTGVVNAPSIAARIAFEDLAARSVALPSLHPDARGLGDVDALVLACLHRLVHHPGDQRLVWDADIVVLSRRIAGRLPELVARAGEWRSGPLVAREIRRAMDKAAAPLSAELAVALDTMAAQPSDALPYARENRSRGDDFAIDWRSLGWRDRLSLARETFLPGAEFVRASSGSRLPLPLLYLRRLAGGALGWFRRPDR